MQAAEAGGRRWDNAMHYKRLMEEAGFVDVTESKFTINTGPWSEKTGEEGAREREVGTLQLQNWLEAMEGMTTRNLARMGWEPMECRDLVAQVKEELLGGRSKSYIDVLVVWGRKPKDVDALNS